MGDCHCPECETSQEESEALAEQAVLSHVGMFINRDQMALALPLLERIAATLDRIELWLNQEPHRR